MGIGRGVFGEVVLVELVVGVGDMELLFVDGVL